MRFGRNEDGRRGGTACTGESAGRMEGRKSVFLVPLPREGQATSGEGQGQQEEQGQRTGGITSAPTRPGGGFRVRPGVEVAEADIRFGGC